MRKWKQKFVKNVCVFGCSGSWYDVCEGRQRQCQNRGSVNVDDDDIVESMRMNGTMHRQCPIAIMGCW